MLRLFEARCGHRHHFRAMAGGLVLEVLFKIGLMPV